jgi:GTP-binding protein EngB required for normal cell division
MGLHQLAKALANTLRRRGSHDALNIVLRGGAGPSYPAVLRGIGQRRGIDMPGDIPGAEIAIVQWWVDKTWRVMDEAQRTEIWHSLAMAPPVPRDHQALISANKSMANAYEYVRAVATIAQVVGAVAPGLGGCITLLNLMAPKDSLILPCILEITRLRQTVLHRVTIGVVGSPSSGKDAAIKAIFGIETGNVNPIAGSTTEVEITRFENATALFLINTPGLGDVVEAVTEEARQVLDHIDIYLYIVNAQGGVQARELDDWERCRESGRPALAIVNKVDTLRDTDRERYLEDAKNKLSVDDANFLAAAFDPLPQLFEHPLGVDPVRHWIHDRLASIGKDTTELPWITGEE